MIITFLEAGCQLSWWLSSNGHRARFVWMVTS